MPRRSPRSLQRYGDLIVRSRAVGDGLTARPGADVAGVPKAGTATADRSLTHRGRNHASRCTAKRPVLTDEEHTDSLSNRCLEIMLRLAAQVEHGSVARA